MKIRENPIPLKDISVYQNPNYRLTAPPTADKKTSQITAWK